MLRGWNAQADVQRARCKVQRLGDKAGRRASLLAEDTFVILSQAELIRLRAEGCTPVVRFDRSPDDMIEVKATKCCLRAV